MKYSFQELDIIQKVVQGMRYLCFAMVNGVQVSKFYAKELKHIPALLKWRNLSNCQVIVRILDPTNEVDKYNAKVLGG